MKCAFYAALAAILTGLSSWQLMKGEWLTGWAKHFDRKAKGGDNVE